ncbi:DnaJ-domain-containing protein [Coniochaeta ligniaria NRRL 30616]|uniref:DnaJ-domain-containing protein n=1 Tax=Coniochaeta ligniaria NRRL 30616 TaxID=1408157 RepID=A0A1J7JJM2_9PEZI|nr:DnaJ-domain-containing protein [Coniochaeta ligniaria NRRL 30616]
MPWTPCCLSLGSRLRPPLLRHCPQCSRTQMNFDNLRNHFSSFAIVSGEPFFAEMDKHKPEPDYYRDLGIEQTASQSHIKKAYYRLAKVHHPDKKAPGQTVDAAEFRQEAYEFLSDTCKRERYDRRYFSVQDDWAHYREWEHEQSRAQEQRRAEDEDRKRKAAEAERKRKMEQARREAEAERMRKEEEARRAKIEKAELERKRLEKQRLAEARSQEAARRARERQEEAAKRRLREQAIKELAEAELARERKQYLRAKEAARRSEQAILKARLEQEREAQERLKILQVMEKQDEVRLRWARMREEAQLKEIGSDKHQPDATRQSDAPALPTCDHPQFGWPRKNGRATCSFCGVSRSKWSFRCPDCQAAACPACKTKYCVL